MNKFRAILYDSFLEIRHRKIFYVYWAVALIMVLAFALMPSMSINGQDILESGMISPEMMTEIQGRFFDQFFGFLIFLMVFGSAGLIPAYLNKGRAELVLSKPISRVRLLAMKFLTVFIIMGAIFVLANAAVWLTISIRLGDFSWYFFSGLILGLVDLLIVYGIVFLLGVISNSGAATIMGYFILRIGVGLLAGREGIYGFLGDTVWKNILDVAYHILPKLSEISDNYISLMGGNGLGDVYAIWSSLVFSAASLTVGLYIFHRRDY